MQLILKDVQHGLDYGRTTNVLLHVFCAQLQVIIGGLLPYSFSMYLLTSIRTWFFLLALVREPFDRIMCILTLTSSLLYNSAYEACMLVMNTASFS